MKAAKGRCAFHQRERFSMTKFLRPGLTRRLLTVFLGAFALMAPASGEGKTTAAGRTPEGRLYREYARDQRLRFAYARSLKITAPPNGNLEIVGSRRAEVSIQAKIHIEGNNEADLDALAQSVGYGVVQDSFTWEIVSVGPQSKFNRKDGKEKRKPPEGVSGNLAKLPYRIDYVIQVPEYVDLEIAHFNGELSLAYLYGGIDFAAQRAKVTLTGLGGTVRGRVGAGEVRVDFTGRSWRGSGIDVQVGAGDIALSLPGGFSANVSLAANQPLDVQYPLNRGENDPADAPIGNRLSATLGVGGAELLFATMQGKIRLFPYASDK
jgi:hypothetical protein